MQVHERITGISRELLMQIKELADDMKVLDISREEAR